MFCTRALMTQNSCAVGMRNAKLGNHLKKVLVSYKKMLTFSAFFNHITLHFSDFHLHFSSTKCNDQCFFPFNFKSYLCLAWLTSIVARG